MKLVLGFALAMFAATPALAKGGYGMAGCGLGSIVADELNWGNGMMQIFAATTNGTAGTQTFGITFGTSNCGDPGSPKARGAVEGKKKAERKVFLRYNMAHIKADAARGEGDYIAGLAGLFGCRNQLTGNYDEFATLSRRHHQDLFNSNDADAVLAHYETVIAAEQLSCAQS